jgi:predicted Fe-Mo cluster-binding NifX family protein
VKVAVSAAGRTLEAPLDQHFGRCSTFMVVETDNVSFEAIDNDSSSLGGGAGIRTAQRIANHGVRAVLTGSCGPNSYQTLGAAGIDVIVGCSGTVADVLARFEAGELRPAAAPNAASHSGAGRERP